MILCIEKEMMKRHSSPQRWGVLIVGTVVFFAGSRLRAQTVAEPHGRTIHPHALGFNAATHRLYCVDQDADRVLVIGPAAQRSSIKVGRQPNAIAIDPALNRIYVVNAGSGNVSVIDGANDRVIATAATDKRPYAIGIDTALHRAYVTNTFSDKVTVVDGTSNSAQQVPLGSKDFVETDARRGRAFFISYEDPALTMLDAAGKTHREDLGLSHPWGLAIDKQRGIVYVTEIGKDTLIAYHENDGRTEKVLTGSMPDAVAIDEAANKIYIANYAADSITVDRRRDDEAGRDSSGWASSAGARGGQQAAPRLCREYAQRQRDRDRRLNQRRPRHHSRWCESICCRRRSRERGCLRCELRRARGYQAGAVVRSLNRRSLTVPLLYNCILRRALVRPLAIRRIAMVKATARMIPGQPAFQCSSKYP